MIHRVRTDFGFHPLGHESLCRRNAHVIGLGEQEPGRAVSPKRPSDFRADAGNRDRPLDGEEHRLLFGGRMGCKSGRSCLLKIKKD